MQRIDLEAQKYRLGAALLRACEVLPDGWTLAVETERDAGTIRLTDPEGDDVEVSYDHDDFPYSVDAAIDQAIELHAKREDNPKENHG